MAIVIIRLTITRWINSQVDFGGDGVGVHTIHTANFSLHAPGCEGGTVETEGRVCPCVAYNGHNVTHAFCDPRTIRALPIIVQQMSV